MLTICHKNFNFKEVQQCHYTAKFVGEDFDGRLVSMELCSHVNGFDVLHVFHMVRLFFVSKNKLKDGCDILI